MELPKEKSIDINGILRNSQLILDEFKAFLNLLDQQPFLEKPTSLCYWKDGPNRISIDRFCAKEVFNLPWKHDNNTVSLEDNTGEILLAYANDNYTNSFDFKISLLNVNQIESVIYFCTTVKTSNKENEY